MLVGARTGRVARPRWRSIVRYREAREAFERIYFENLLAQEQRQHVTRGGALAAWSARTSTAS